MPLLFVTVSLRTSEKYEKIIGRLRKCTKTRMLVKEKGSGGDHPHIHCIVEINVFGVEDYKIYLEEKIKIPKDQRKHGLVVKYIDDQHREAYYVGYMCKEPESEVLDNLYSNKYIDDAISYYKMEEAKNAQKRQKNKRTYDGTLLAKDIYDSAKEFKGFDQVLAIVYNYSFEHGINIVSPDAIARMVMQIAYMKSGKCVKIPEKKNLGNSIESYFKCQD